MGLIIRYATKPSAVESGTVYECEELKSGPSTLLINITNQIYEYQYKREISHHNVNGHQGNAMLQKVKPILCLSKIFLLFTPLREENKFQTIL